MMSSVSVRGFVKLSQFVRNHTTAPNGYVKFRGNMTNRHRDPRWKKHRANQTVRIKLPDFEEIRRGDDRRSMDEIRTLYKEKGIMPGRSFLSRPMYMSSLSTVVEPYVPPEGDGKATLLSGSGAKQRMEQLGKKTKQLMQLRKIRQFDEDFEMADFVEVAHEIYVKTHEALAANDKETLTELATEKCYTDMVKNVELKTIRWSFVGSLEPGRVVHVQTQDALSKDNIFAQVTVRFNTQQTLAVYDRFGRLMHGSEAMVKDVLEYVVFEKHMSNVHGKWRLHAKIIPEWQAISKVPRASTCIQTEENTEDKTTKSTVPQIADGKSPESSPAATATN